MCIAKDKLDLPQTVKKPASLHIQTIQLFHSDQDQVQKIRTSEEDHKFPNPILCSPITFHSTLDIVMSQVFLILSQQCQLNFNWLLVYLSDSDWLHSFM